MNKLLIILALFLSFDSYSAELDALSNHTYDGWTKELAEVSYVSSRCSALYKSIQAYVLANDPQRYNELNVKQRFGNASDKLLDFSAEAAKRSQISVENFKQRYIELSKAYTKKISTNKILNNNIFDDSINQELSVCSTIVNSIK